MQVEAISEKQTSVTASLLFATFLVGIIGAGLGVSFWGRTGSLLAGASLVALGSWIWHRKSRVDDKRTGIALLVIGSSFALSAFWTEIPVPLVGLAAFFIAKPKLRIVLGIASAKSFVIAAFFMVLSCFALARWVNSSSSIIFLTVPIPTFATESVYLSLVVLGLGALFNSIFEETLWRWLLWRVGIPFRYLTLSLGFGIAHWNSIPNGIVGVFMASLFGFGMHYVTYRFKGSILVPITIHFFSDLTVLVLLFGIER